MFYYSEELTITTAALMSVTLVVKSYPQENVFFRCCVVVENVIRQLNDGDSIHEPLKMMLLV